MAEGNKRSSKWSVPVYLGRCLFHIIWVMGFGLCIAVFLLGPTELAQRPGAGAVSFLIALLSCLVCLVNRIGGLWRSKVYYICFGGILGLVFVGFLWWLWEPYWGAPHWGMLEFYIFFGGVASAIVLEWLWEFDFEREFSAKETSVCPSDRLRKKAGFDGLVAHWLAMCIIAPVLAACIVSLLSIGLDVASGKIVSWDDYSSTATLALFLFGFTLIFELSFLSLPSLASALFCYALIYGFPRAYCLICVLSTVFVGFFASIPLLGLVEDDLFGPLEGGWVYFIIGPLLGLLAGLRLIRYWRPFAQAVAAQRQAAVRQQADAASAS